MKKRRGGVLLRLERRRRGGNGKTCGSEAEFHRIACSSPNAMGEIKASAARMPRKLCCSRRLFYATKHASLTVVIS